MEFITCPHCRGEGAVDGQKCPECNGHGLYGWFGGRLLVWTKDFSWGQAAFEKIRRLILAFINLILILFGILGLVSLLRLVLELQILDRFPSSPLVFWLSVLTDMYLISRWQRAKEKSRRKLIIKLRKTKAALPEWPDARVLSKKLQIDVSEALEPKLTKALFQARKNASRFKHRQILPIHLFIGLLTTGQVSLLLNRLAVDWKKLKEKISTYLAKEPPAKQKITPQISSDIKKNFFQAYILASEKRHPRITPLDILTVIVAQEGPVKEILYDLEIGIQEVKNVCLWIEVNEELRMAGRRFRGRAALRPKGAAGRVMTGVATPILDRFSHDLTELARLGYLTSCMDREKEMAAMFRVIEGRKSVCLVGPPGVGRTTLINGLARRMVTEDVPEILQDKRLVSLSLPSLVAGASRPGEVEQRVQTIMNEIIRAGNVALFIKGIHSIVGVKTVKGGTDVADMLVSYLKQGFLTLVSTSNPQDFRRYIEQSPLAEVLHRVNIEEPDTNTTIQILEAQAGRIEYRHRVYFSYQALARAAELSERFLHERYQPEKAITLAEEAAIYAQKIRGKNTIVQAEDVAEIIAQKTKVPVTKVTEKERAKLLNLEDQIHQRIIDQDEAVDAVASALRRSRAELRDVKRPIVNLLFLGPTGVGKTELAKTVAAVYFGSEERMIRLDMSEYQQVDSIGRLIGTPDGKTYGFLTEAVRKAPFSLLLLDEIEKAHPDILNIFLQVMDDGRLTDNLGRVIDFTNIILIGTSNAGTSFIQEAITKGKKVKDIKQILIREKLKSYFRPEFLNRFDDIIVFKPLGMEEIKQIAKLLLAKLQKQLSEKGITLEATDEAIAELAQAGFDPIFGARPLRRAIQGRINNALANFMLGGKIGRRDIAILEPGGKITIKKAE